MILRAILSLTAMLACGAASADWCVHDTGAPSRLPGFNLAGPIVMPPRGECAVGFVAYSGEYCGELGSDVIWDPAIPGARCITAAEALALAAGACARAISARHVAAEADIADTTQQLGCMRDPPIPSAQYCTEQDAAVRALALGRAAADAAFAADVAAADLAAVDACAYVVEAQ